jgi:uncharacterized membrane-anchored protein YhcB (DUF1043 family)
LVCGITAIIGVIVGALIVMLCDKRIIIQKNMRKTQKAEEKSEKERKLEENILQQMQNLLTYDGGVKPRCEK